MSLLRRSASWRDVTLTTDRLLLRAPRAGDEDGAAASVGHWEVVRMLAQVPWPYGRAEAVRYVEQAQAEMDGRRALHFFLIDEDGIAGGFGLAFSPVSLFAPAPVLGYWLSPNRWGRGYATEAGRAVLDHAFRAMKLKAVRSGVFFDNPASLRVQEKLGFEVVGRSEVFCLARGKTLSHIDTLMTRDRYLERRAEEGR